MGAFITSDEREVKGKSGEAAQGVIVVLVSRSLPRHVTFQIPQKNSDLPPLGQKRASSDALQ